MPRSYSVCQHVDRKSIDSRIVSGESLRTIALQTGTSAMALQRHKEHIPAALATAHEAKEVAAADDLLQEVRALRSKSYSILLAAEKAGDLRTALVGIREARGCLELLARLVGELDQRPVVNLLMAPEWLGLRGTILAALQPYPEARATVAERLSGGAAPAPAGTCP